MMKINYKISGVLNYIRRIDKAELVVYLAFVLGFFLHFRNLAGARMLDPDEARAFAVLPTGPLIYLLCRPFYLLMLTESSGFYAAALFGAGSIAVFFILSRMVFDKWHCALSTLAFAVFPLRINYARRLFPAVFTDFFALLLLLFLVAAIVKRKRYFMLLAGMISATLLFIHPFTYAISFGAIVAVFLFWILNRKEIGMRKLADYSLMYITGSIIGYVLLEILVRYLPGGFSFTEVMLGVHSDMLDWVRAGVTGILPVFADLVNSPLSILRTQFVWVAIGFSAWGLRGNKKSALSFFMIYGLAGLAILMLNISLRVHVGLFIRMLVWLLPVLSWCIGYFCYHVFARAGANIRKVIIAYAFFFFLSSIVLSYLVTTETFRTTMISEWLGQNKIPKNQVLTFLNMYRRGDTVGVNYPPIDYHPSWTLTDQRYTIIWPLVYKAYREGLATHIIPTGTGPHLTLEYGDKMFKGVYPVRSWVHPYSKFKYRFPRSECGEGKIHMINVYNLDDIFSPKRRL